MTATPAPHQPTTTRDELASLASLAKAGDRQAEDQLYGVLLQVVARRVRAELGRRRLFLSEDEIDDLVQDTVIACWTTDLPRYDPERGALIPFVHRRVGWRLIDVVRKQSRRLKHTVPLDDVDEPSSVDCNPEVVGSRRRFEADLQKLAEVVPLHLAQLAKGRGGSHIADSVLLTTLGSQQLHEVAAKRRTTTSTICRARQRGLSHLRRTLPQVLREAA